MRPMEIRRSFSGPMALAGFCFPVSAQKAAKVKWMANRRFYMANISGYQRIVTHVYMRSMYGKRYYMMDVITGTLYRRKDGQCATSDYLKLISLSKQDGLTQKLLKMRVSLTGGEE